ncbi:MAG: NlpC/P60 family protein [Chthoniobacterales bacterium]
MLSCRLTGWLAAGLIGVALYPAAALVRGEEPSLGEKIQKFFATPTPTPSRRRPKRTKGTPTHSPSPSVSPKAKARAKHKSSPSPTETPTASPEATSSPTPTSEKKVATVSPSEIQDYNKNPAPVSKLLDDALELTKRGLGYTYGSADPERGGMDCSGFIYYVLRENGVEDVPRDASEQYVWVRKAGNFRAVLSRNIDSFELDELKPGDLLFWAGTYNIERDPPVTHTMIYLGKEKKTGKPIMVGASDGRTYEGEKQFGVSVFDFKTAPASAGGSAERRPQFVGYGKIPGLGGEKP